MEYNKIKMCIENMVDTWDIDRYLDNGQLDLAYQI